MGALHAASFGLGLAAGSAFYEGLFIIGVGLAIASIAIGLHKH